MNDDELRASVLATLSMTDATKDEQDEVLYRVESIAHKRLSLALPEMLTEEQMEQVEAMEAAGKDNEEIADWVESQLPQYDEMIRAIVQDVADEIAEL